MDDRGEWAVVMEVFPDGSARVRVEEGRDVALHSWAVGHVSPGESGRLLGRKRRGVPLRFFPHAPGPQT